MILKIERTLNNIRKARKKDLALGERRQIASDRVQYEMVADHTSKPLILAAMGECTPPILGFGLHIGNVATQAHGCYVLNSICVQFAVNISFWGGTHRNLLLRVFQKAHLFIRVIGMIQKGQRLPRSASKRIEETVSESRSRDMKGLCLLQSGIIDGDTIES